MEADFDRYYSRDLAQMIWAEHWPARRIWARITSLPETSAFRRARSQGHTSIHELLASIHDRVTTTAHGYRLEGKPQDWPRPNRPTAPVDGDALDPTNPDHASALIRFFGRPR